MKDCLIALVILFFLGGCGKPEEQFSSWDESGLKGKVKTLTEIQYFTRENNGEYVWVLNPYVDMSVYHYDHKGCLIEHDHYLMFPDKEEVFYTNHIRSIYTRKDTLLTRITSYNPDTSYYQFSVVREMDDQRILEVYDKYYNRIKTHYLRFSDGKVMETLSDTLHIRYIYEGDVLKYSVNIDDGRKIVLEYNYPEHDALGNWTKRETKEREEEEEEVIHSITFRDIEYFE